MMTEPVEGLRFTFDEFGALYHLLLDLSQYLSSLMRMLVPLL